MNLGVRAALVDGVVVAGDVDIDDGFITRIGVTPAGARELAVPGLIDVQVNGFAGVDFTTAEPEDYATAAAAMATTGVTSFQPTLISLPRGRLCLRLRASGGNLDRDRTDPRHAPRGSLPVAVAVRSPRPRQHGRSRYRVRQPG